MWLICYDIHVKILIIGKILYFLLNFFCINSSKPINFCRVIIAAKYFLKIIIIEFWLNYASYLVKRLFIFKFLKLDKKMCIRNE